MAKTLSEQVARLERERDGLLKEVDAEVDTRLYWERRFEEEKQLRTTAESRLADAERRGAREALTRMMDALGNRVRSNTDSTIRAFRDREYPAVAPEREGARTCVCGHDTGDHYGYDAGKRGCVADQMRCACDDFRPTPPQAAPEPDTAELGEYEVRYVAGHLPWKAERVHLVGGTLGRVKSASCHSLPSLLDCLGVTPTTDQYAAMLRLMETARRASGRDANA